MRGLFREALLLAPALARAASLGSLDGKVPADVLCAVQPADVEKGSVPSAKIALRLPSGGGVESGYLVIQTHLSSLVLAVAVDIDRPPRPSGSTSMNPKMPAVTQMPRSTANLFLRVLVAPSASIAD